MRQLLARCAVRRAHVLTVEAPGRWLVRAEVERAVRARGWCLATSPADADVLAVCGTPGPELARAVERVWDQLPGPRVRVELRAPKAVASGLDRALVELVDTDGHRRDACARAHFSEMSDEHGHAGRHDEKMHGGMDHGAHHDSDHGAGRAPAGIALAEGGEDRDGLEMDVLHLRLGPVLCHWPAGLVLRCALHGDVLVDAQAWLVDDNSQDAMPGSRDGDNAALLAARQCDHACDLLMLAGWPWAAATARQARDALMNRPTQDRGRRLIDHLHRRLGRSPMLRWSLRDLASLTVEDCNELQLPAWLAGDCYDRLLTRVDMARRLLWDPSAPRHFHAASAEVVAALPGLVSGLDLATARLVIASLGVDPAGGDIGGQDG
ncbi:hypothetical protein [Mycobacterium simiae]|uniref:hypothetical protein n=1 Tax=Mycobacterium simiae TaxID=1784 RepID=UPI0021CD8461|nr:hypothetical protein [Mycobacterium simiae]